mgnify:CR=1 FL=1
MDLQEWVESLQQTERLIVVEGKNDVIALQELGIVQARPLNTQPIFLFAESIEEKEVIILTDLDPAGRKLYRQLKRALVKRGKKIDNIFREFLFKETSLSEIEGLPTYLRNNA